MKKLLITILSIGLLLTQVGIAQAQWTSWDSWSLWIQISDTLFTSTPNLNVDLEEATLTAKTITDETLTITGGDLTTTGHLQAANFATDEVTTHNIFVGDDADGSGTPVLSIGEHSGENSSGNYQVNVGNYAAQNNTADNVTVVGFTAGQDNTGEYLTGEGYAGGQRNEGARLTFLGGFAGQNNLGDDGTLIGYLSGQHNTENNLVGVGNSTGQWNTGENMTGGGNFAGRWNDSDNVTIFGFNAFNTWTDDTASEKTFDNTDIVAATDRITITGHSFGANDSYLNLKYDVGTSAITGLTDGEIYQWKIIDTNTLELRIGDITDAGSGTGHTFTPKVCYANSSAFGYDAEPDAANQIMLGDGNVTEVKTAGGVTSGGTVTADELQVAATINHRIYNSSNNLYIDNNNLENLIYFRYKIAGSVMTNALILVGETNTAIFPNEVITPELKLDTLSSFEINPIMVSGDLDINGRSAATATTDAPDVLVVTGGKGGVWQSPTIGGKGSDISLTAGLGGDGQAGTSGHGGDYYSSSGEGGLGGTIAGDGGYYYIVSGDGGDNSGPPGGGDSGDIRIIIGTPGTNGGSSGIFGNIIMAQDGGSVGIADTSPDSALEVSSAGDDYFMISSYDDGDGNILLVDSVGTAIFGLPATNLSTEADGDTYWTGEGSGLPYGSFYGNNINFTHDDFGGGGTFIIISDSDSTAGALNNTTFQADQQLVIEKAGDYLITWSASVEVAVANKHIELAPGINGTANIAGRQHVELASANKEESIAGTAIIAAAASETISLMITNVDDDTAVEVHHINLTAVQVGG